MHPEHDRSLYQASISFPSLDGLEVTNRADIGAHVEPPTSEPALPPIPGKHVMR